MVGGVVAVLSLIVCVVTCKLQRSRAPSVPHLTANPSPSRSPNRRVIAKLVSQPHAKVCEHSVTAGSGGGEADGVEVSAVAVGAVA